MSGAVVPWLLLGDTRRRSLAQRVSRDVQSWQSAWLPEYSGTVGVEIEDLRARPTDIRAREACCFRVLSNRDTALVLVVPRRALAGLVGAPSHGTDASSRFAGEGSLVAALEMEALLRLSRQMLSGVTAGVISLERLEQSATDAFREYDDARFVCASITLGDSRCTLDALIAPFIVEKLMPQRPAAPDAERVERRRMATAAQVVEVEGVLGFAEVAVADLAGLSVGDVIVLQQQLSDPCVLTVRGGERVSGAVVGCVDGQRALKIEGRVA